jgi:hypothetical protein
LPVGRPCAECGDAPPTDAAAGVCLRSTSRSTSNSFPHFVRCLGAAVDPADTAAVLGWRLCRAAFFSLNPLGVECATIAEPSVCGTD